MTAFALDYSGTFSLLDLPTSDDALPPAVKAGDADCYRSHSLQLPTPWRETSSTALHLLYKRSATELRAVLSETPLEATLENFTEHQTRSIDLCAPVELQTVAIPKPWGQELWYSGIEARGESSVLAGDKALPLSHYLALAPQLLCRRAQPLLLKVLDPTPDPVLGDLYFETHDQKHEVYVVTHVDRSAWPDGTGAIRFGMNQTKRAAYATDADFRRAYLEAVTNYERVRREIDSTTTTASADLAESEVQLRSAMEAFTQLQPLRVGDIVQVPPGVPHALQHGVRVFEFQTPVYERNIISFNQQVLTQDHWDSERAIEQLESAEVALSSPAKVVDLIDNPSLQCRRIADFADFEVQRIQIKPTASWQAELSLPAATPYLMVAIIEGDVVLDYATGQLTLGSSRAAFVPASTVQLSIRSALSGPSSFLVAAPKPHTAASIGSV